MKKLLASIMAISMVFAVTGCSESNDSSSEAESSAAATTTTTAAAAEDTETTPTAAPAESETETTAPADSSDDQTTDDGEAEGTYENNVYDCDLYSFTIDSSKWAIGETSGVDCMFTYADSSDDANLASASINVISMSDELLNGLTAADYADQIKASYNAMDGYTVTNDKEDKFAGKDAHIVDVTGEIGSVTVYLNQIIVSDNGNLIVVTYGANDAAYDKLQDEFKTVLDSFKIK